jgi:hypothetical protein
MALYYYKSTKISDDLRKEANFVRLTVKRIKSNNTKNMSVELIKAINQLIKMLERNETIHKIIQAREKPQKAKAKA